MVIPSLLVKIRRLVKIYKFCVQKNGLIILLAVFEIILFFILFIIIFIYCCTVGKNIKNFYNNFLEIKTSFKNQTNFFGFFKNLLNILKNQVFFRIYQEKTKFSLCKNNFSRILLISSWVCSFFAISIVLTSYIKSLRLFLIYKNRKFLPLSFNSKIKSVS